MSTQSGTPAPGGDRRAVQEASQQRRKERGATSRHQKQDAPSQHDAALRLAQERVQLTQAAIQTLWEKRWPLEEEYGRIIRDHGIESDEVAQFLEGHQQFSDTAMDEAVTQSILAAQDYFTLQHLQHQQPAPDPAQLPSPLGETEAPSSRPRYQPAAVRAENGQWTASAAIQPPFSVAEFEAGLATARAIGGGTNRPRAGTIAGDRYLIKLIRPENTLGALFGDEFLRDNNLIEIANPAAFEAAAEGASTQIARQLDMADIVAESYAFEHRGKQYTTSRWLDDTTDIYGTNGLHFDKNGNLPQSELDRLSTRNLQRVVLLEYYLGDADGQAGNYRIYPDSGNFVRIDWNRAYRSTSIDIRASTAADMFSQKAGGASNATLSREDIEKIVTRESDSIAIMKSLHLHSGIPCIQLHTEHLRGLLQKSGDITLADIGYTEPEPW